MTDDVEQLARVLYEARVDRRRAPGWDRENDIIRDAWREVAREAIKRGVTLSAPVAPRLTPLQAAALVLAKWGWGGDKHTVEEASDAMDCARDLLAAAVGALPDGPHPDECSIGSGMERQLVSRAALLAALTEGGEG